MLYVNMQSPEAARTYLRAIAREYPDTEWAGRSLLEEARSFSRQGMSIQADEVYQQLIDRYPGTDEARPAGNALRARGFDPLLVRSD